MTPIRRPPVDQSEREAAVRERNRNVLIDAGAGTGKTTIVIDRVLDLIAPADDGRAIELGRLIVMTFTRRAAGELRLRLREALLKTSTDERGTKLKRERLRVALSQLDTAYVGTIHSIADRLLRLHPIESHLSPSYEVLEDDEEILDDTWHQLLHAVEQGTLAGLVAGTRAEPWADETSRAITDALRCGIPAKTWETEFYTKHGLSTLVVALLRNRDVRPVDVPEPTFDMGLLRAAIHEFITLARPLPGDSSFARWARNAADRFDRVRGVEDAAVLFVEVAQSVWEKRRSTNRPQKRRDCDGDADVWRFWKVLHEGAPQRDAGHSPLGDELVKPLHAWLANRLLRVAPVIEELYEREKARRKVVDQIDLLLRLRDLLRADKASRGFYQRLFDHVLVDEFQDTDPLQTEIVLYLCERSSVADRWEDVVVDDGRLTLVGDPKQSIYRFRRADVAMYESIRSRIGPRALSVELRANFRTQPTLVALLNEQLRGVLGTDQDGRVFDIDSGRVFHRPLAAGRDSDAGEVLHVVPFEPAEETSLDANGWRQLEARALTRYLDWLVNRSGHRLFDSKTDEQRRVKYGDVCILTLATTHVPLLLRELNVLGLPYTAAGGKLFLEDPLHVQFLLALRALSDPTDGVAQAALLRPPFFAVDLADVASWHSDPKGDGQAIARVRTALEQIHELRRLRFERSPGATARRLLDGTGLARHVALQPGGAERLARLRELTYLADRVAITERLDFDGVTHRLRGWVDRPASLDPPAPLDSGALRVLTVHQSKGLEFPVVVWWDGQAPMRGPNVRPPWRIARDGRSWSLTLHGLEQSEPAGTNLAGLERAYLDEERRRLVYVACTRARDLLVLPDPRGATPRGQPICRELVPPEGTRGVRYLETFSASDGAPWAANSEPGSTSAAAVAETLERDIEGKWAAALSAAQRADLRPVAVTARAAASGADAADDETTRKRHGSRYGRRFGITVHRAIESVLTGASPTSKDAVHRVARATGLSEHLDQAVADVDRVLAALSNEGWDRTVGPHLRLEYPVSGRAKNGALLLGSIDLVAVHGDCISVVDFKTDAPPPAGSPVEESYRNQVFTYAELLAEAGVTDGLRLRSGILFTADGSMRWIRHAGVPVAQEGRRRAPHERS